MCPSSVRPLLSALYATLVLKEHDDLNLLLEGGPYIGIVAKGLQSIPVPGKLPPRLRKSELFAPSFPAELSLFLRAPIETVPGAILAFALTIFYAAPESILSTAAGLRSPRPPNTRSLPG